jgi:hypothetical protein
LVDVRFEQRGVHGDAAQPDLSFENVFEGDHRFRLFSVL